jgi:hypothetical protein
VEWRKANHTCRKPAAAKPARSFLVVEAVRRGRPGSRSRIGRWIRRRNLIVMTPFDFYSPPWSAVVWADKRRQRHEKVSTQRNAGSPAAAMLDDRAGRYIY